MATDLSRQALYVDSSAIVKLIVREKESGALLRHLAPADLVSSEIATVELPRVAFLKTGEAAAIAQAERVLRRFDLVALDVDLYAAAARIGPPELRTLDAIHLASALSLGDALDALVAYDGRLAKAARDAGLPVHTPA